MLDSLKNAHISSVKSPYQNDEIISRAHNDKKSVHKKVVSRTSSFQVKDNKISMSIGAVVKYGENNKSSLHTSENNLNVSAKSHSAKRKKNMIFDGNGDNLIFFEEGDKDRFSSISSNA